MPSTPSTRINITPVARREEAIQRGLKRRLEQLSEERERRALARWLGEHNSSPMTGKIMGARMITNHALKSMIAKYDSTSA